MKYAYEVKLVAKKETGIVKATIEDMESEGWSTHRITDDAIIFRRAVPENYVRAWFVVDWENVDGKQVEVKHGPYYSQEDAANVIDPAMTLRVDKTWIPPEESPGSRMDRIAMLVAAAPSDPPPIEAKPPKTKRKPKSAPVDRDNEADFIRNSVNTHIPPEDLNRIRNFIAGTPDPVPAAAPVSRPAVNRSSRASIHPVVTSHAAVRRPPASGRPQQQQVRTGILDAMRGPSAAKPATSEKDPDEPSDLDIRNMMNQRILQAMRRHDQ